MNTRIRTLAALVALAAGTGLFLLTALAGPRAAAAVACPVVDAATGAVTPAPAPGIDWLGCNLTDANLTGADLSGADLLGTTLVNANLTDSNLSGANLAAAQLNNTSFTGASLTGVRSGSITTLGGSVTLPASWTLAEGYLMGPEADLADAQFLPMDLPLGAVDLQGANLTGAGFGGNALDGTNLTAANLAGADLSDVTLESVNVTGAQFSGANFLNLRMYTYSLDNITPVTGVAASLPENWTQVGNYLLGPTVIAQDANISGADLAGVDLWAGNLINTTLSGNLTGADLYGAGIASVGGTLSDTICPDGTNSDADGEDCSSHLTSVPVAFPNVGGLNVTFGDPQWYRNEGQLVTWNWTDLTGGLNNGVCPATSVSSGEGRAVKVTASCRNAEGGVGAQTVTLSIDPTTPKVTVTGLRNGRVYALGRVPAAGCKTADSLSGISKQAAVKITPAGSTAPGTYMATCSGAITGAGMPQSAPVSVSYKAAYGFTGFVTPKAGSVLSHAKVLLARFHLAGSNGKPLGAKTAAALARAGKVGAELKGPGVRTVTARCSWNSARRYFQCSIAVPAHVRTGRTAYSITATEKVGPTTVTAPGVGSATNPVRIRFR